MQVIRANLGCFSAATLSDVIDYYAQRGRTNSGRYAGIGRNNSNKDSLIRGFELPEHQLDDLKAFLHSLIDKGFLRKPSFANPWPEGHPANGILSGK